MVSASYEYLRTMQRLCVFGLGMFMALASYAQHEKGIERVRAALLKDKPYRAIALSQRVISKNDTPAVVLALRADAYNRIGKYEVALGEAQRARKELPTDVELRAQLMGAFLGLGMPDSALAMALENAAPNEVYLLRKGMAQQQLNELSKALATFDEGVRAFPNSAALARERGAAYALSGDSAKARMDLDRAIELAPRDPVNYNHRGYFRYALFGDHAQAIRDMDRAIKLDPNYGYAFSNRGWSRYKLGETGKAVKDLKLAARKNPGNSYVYRSLGIIDLDAGNTDAACSHFSEAIKLGFTNHYGSEVQALMDKHCAGGKPEVLPTPVAPKPAAPPANAPGGAPEKSNAP